jgi:hypothetical protein
MAFTYRIRRVEANQTLDPRDWNMNMALFAAEMNGRLDRDNIPESAITGDHILAETFTLVDSDTRTTDITIPGGDMGWQDGDGTNAINSIDFTAVVDSMVDVWWGCTYSWDAISSWPVGTADAQYLMADFRLVVDGVELDCSPGHSMMRLAETITLVGTGVVGPGPHTVKVQVRTYYEGEGALDTTDTLTVHVSELILEATVR